MKRYFIFLSLQALLFSNLIFAGDTGKISGIITDAETGEALVGANVVVESIWQNNQNVDAFKFL